MPGKHLLGKKDDLETSGKYIDHHFSATGLN